MATLALNLPTSPRTSVFRALDKILRNDPVLQRTVRPQAFRSWSGNSYDSVDFTLAMAPCLRLTPSNGPEVWKFPDAFVGPLFIKVEMLVAGYDVDDVLNLWWAIEKALYPSDNVAKSANISTLQAAGAYTGLAEFTQPAFDDSPENKFFAAYGQIKIDVLLQLAP